jgi:hypothetical protein
MVDREPQVTTVYLTQLLQRVAAVAAVGMGPIAQQLRAALVVAEHFQISVKQEPLVKALPERMLASMLAVVVVGRVQQVRFPPEVTLVGRAVVVFRQTSTALA